MQLKLYTILAKDDDGQPVLLPHYSGSTAVEVEERVRGTAERRGYQGTGAQCIKDMGWAIVEAYVDVSM